MEEIYLHVCIDAEENEKAMEILKMLKGVRVRIVGTGTPPYDEREIPWISTEEKICAAGMEENICFAGLDEIREYVTKRLTAKAKQEAAASA